MSAGDGALEAFKARLPLAEIVGRYVKLTRRGREHVGLCPFHKEKTPSFNVVEEKGFYHCFGCGAHGTAIDFVMAIEGLSFADALARIADLTGIPAPRRANAAKPEPSGRLLAANAAAAAWFQDQLKAGSGAEAKAYLDRRGLGAEVIQAFALGYAPDGRGALKRALLAQGFVEAELLAAGLLAQAAEGGESFDRFRHRIMFPIHDERGRVLGFGGRALGAARAKYLNTPETELFHKGELLYNLHRAQKPARERREIVLAEGYMDVIALVQAGLDHAVAPLGTAVTERQLLTLWRFAEAPIVCLDGDRAGLAAALRAAERALPLMRGDRSLRFAVLPEGEDPDSYLRHHGAEALAGVLSKAHSLSQMIWRLETQGKRFATPEARAALGRRLRGFVRLAADPDLRAALDAQFRTLQDALFPRPTRGARRPASAPSSARKEAGAWEGVGAARLAAGVPDPVMLKELRLLAPVLAIPSLLFDLEEEFARIELTDPGLEAIRKEILDWYVSGAPIEPAALQSHLTARFGAERIGHLEAAAPSRDRDGPGLRGSLRAKLQAHLKRAGLAHERAYLEQSLREGDHATALAASSGIAHLLAAPGEGDEEDQPADWQDHVDALEAALRDVLERVRGRPRKPE